MRSPWYHPHNPFGPLDQILFLGVEEPVQPANDPDLFGPRYRQGARGYGGFYRYFLAGAGNLQNPWGEGEVRRGLYHVAPALLPALLARLQGDWDLYAYRDPGRVDRLPRPLQAAVVAAEHYEVISFASGRPLLLERLLIRLPEAAALGPLVRQPALGAHVWDYLVAVPRGAWPFAGAPWPALAGVLTQAGRVWSEAGGPHVVRGEAASLLPGPVWFAGVAALLDGVAAVLTFHEDWQGPPGDGHYLCLSTRRPLAADLEALCRDAFPTGPAAAFRREELQEGFMGQEHWFDFFRPPFFKA